MATYIDVERLKIALQYNIVELAEKGKTLADIDKQNNLTERERYELYRIMGSIHAFEYVKDVLLTEEGAMSFMGAFDLAKPNETDPKKPGNRFADIDLIMNNE
jgi:hypothetical protein